MKLEPLSLNITTQGFKQQVLHTRESTSSSPSGRHYGILRANVQHETLLTIHTILATAPFRHGFILERWKHVIQVMIKKTKDALVTKRRMIELFESDFSAVVEMEMNQTMRHLDKQNEIVSGTFATVKGGSTHSALFSRIFAYDLAHITRSAIATVDNDAVGCYDQMVPALMRLLLQRIGWTLEATCTFVYQLTNRSRRIQTAYDLSDQIEPTPTSDEPKEELDKATPADQLVIIYNLSP